MSKIPDCWESCHVDVPCPHGLLCNHLHYANEMLEQGRISMIKIKDIEHLKRESKYDDCATDSFEGCISLADGSARSSKRLTYYADTDSWDVYHESDEIEEYFPTTEKMLENTNIGLAIERGAFYQYDYSTNKKELLDELYTYVTHDGNL